MQLNIALHTGFFNKVLVEDIENCGDTATVVLIDEQKFINYR